MAVQLTKEMIQGAQETERMTGVPTSITLSQIIEESSGKYEGGLSYLAYKGNNLFGVKSFSASDEKIYVRNSDGLVAWKKYDTQYDSIIDHARILNLDRYKSRYSNATSVSDYAQALQDGGYAGNSTTYANKLMSHIDNYDLNQYNLNVSTSNSDNGNGGQVTDKKQLYTNIINYYYGNDEEALKNVVNQYYGDENTWDNANEATRNAWKLYFTPELIANDVQEYNQNTLDWLGQVLKYLSILLISVIGVYFIIKALGIEVIK